MGLGPSSTVPVLTSCVIRRSRNRVRDAPRVYVRARDRATHADGPARDRDLWRLGAGGARCDDRNVRARPGFDDYPPAPTGSSTSAPTTHGPTTHGPGASAT